MAIKLSQEDAVRKAQGIHGDKYDLSKLVYTKNKSWVTVGCKIHGDFSVIFRDFTKKVNPVCCQKCSKEQYLANRVEWNLIPEVDAVSRMKSAHGDRFDYSDLEYKSFTAKAKIKCPVHGDFWMRPDEHEYSVYGCPSCGKEQSAKSRTTSKHEWVDKVTKLYGDKYDYSLVPEGVNSKERFQIVCKEHGVFRKSWNELTSNIGDCTAACPKCSINLMADKYKSCSSDFIEKAKKVHGDKYDYSLVNYERSRLKVDIICNEHGTFTQGANKHLSGRGCPKCAKNGFRVTKTGYLYVLQDDNVVKVGITNRDVEVRLSEINESQRNFKEVSRYSFEDGQMCLDVETKLLKFLRSNYKAVDDKFSGSTECFVDADVTVIEELIDNLMEVA